MTTGKRGDEGRVCLCDRPDGTCAGLAVRRLSRERVRELAEEIWTASSGGLPPARSVSDPRSSRAGASAQGAFVRRREQERQSWRPGWAWWTCAVVGAAGADALMIGPTVGAWLAWPMALLLAGWTGWRLRFRLSAGASVWQRQAAMQRRTAAALAPRSPLRPGPCARCAARPRRSPRRWTAGPASPWGRSCACMAAGREPSGRSRACGS